jgi:four helix bundle protein
MNTQNRLPNGKPYDIHERLLLFACDIVRTAQFLHTRGPIGRELSYQILSAGTSAGANAEESDGASSHRDFIAKNRIALKETKETRFRLRVCRGCDLLDAGYDALVNESDELEDSCQNRSQRHPPTRGGKGGQSPKEEQTTTRRQ